VAAAAPSSPAERVLAKGSFVNKEESGSGTARLSIAADDTTYLRLESLAIADGPALHVLLTKHPNPSTAADVELGSVDLGTLRATKGNLTYPIPNGVDGKAYPAVIVYCVEYHVVFASATLTP
jgi:hypothetical protein